MDRVIIHKQKNEISQTLEKAIEQEVLDEVYVLVGALKVLGHVDASRSYAAKITALG